MSNKLFRYARRLQNFAASHFFKCVPRKRRFSIYRSFIKCTQTLPENLVLKIADTQEEIEACLKLLHDCYIECGFMKPDPSGMRVTIYHALPTTTTLCAKFNDRVVGTISLIRDGPFGFPLQKIFDLREIRLKEGAIAEVSALAVHRSFRRQGGIIFLPLMKFMYQYCVAFFDVRHLVIAVNPRHIEMYESLLLFKRLQERPVENYEFVNGAPAIGATLDLQEALELFKKIYGAKLPEKNLYDYFVRLQLDNFKLPERRFFTTNDPVMTPALLDYFFNVRTRCFQHLNERDRALLHTIYDLPEYHAVLPDFSKRTSASRLRHHARFSYKCPGRFIITRPRTADVNVDIELIELSRHGFVAYARSPLLVDTWGRIEIWLGPNEVSYSPSCVMRDLGKGLYSFHVESPDLVWRKFVAAISKGGTKEDLNNATHFLDTQ